MTEIQLAALREVAWGTEHFGALVTGGPTRKRDVMALAKLGLVADAGMCVMCDGDGFKIQPERYRRGWKITAKGKLVLEAAGAGGSASAQAGAQRGAQADGHEDAR
jgi:hypothetical protein